MGTLLGAAEIREIAARIGVNPTKKLGQNFVVDANTCRRIVKIADVQNDDITLEIGPGLGSLTLALLEISKIVIAVEIDKRLAIELSATATSHGFDSQQLIVINEDALTTLTLPLNPTVLVANLPYNVSVPVLLRILEIFPTIRSGVVMVQSEVADRLVARPNSKNYGSPSVKVTWWADLSSAGNVARQVFWPIPNVDSSLVRFVRHQAAGEESQRVLTFKVIDAAFAQRRKMLRSALSQIFAGEAERKVLEAGVDPTVRGETLLLSDFISIANTLRA